jgi:hypothetical protein
MLCLDGKSKSGTKIEMKLRRYHIPSKCVGGCEINSIVDTLYDSYMLSNHEGRGSD